MKPGWLVALFLFLLLLIAFGEPSIDRLVESMATQQRCTPGSLMITCSEKRGE